MEPMRYKTKIKGNEIFLPDAILQKIDLNAEVEIVVRAISFPQKTSESIDQVLEKTTEHMNKKYPNLNLKINSKLKAIAGISSNISDRLSRFSDKEILRMGQMEKYMEKGEILESLY